MSENYKNELDLDEKQSRGLKPEKFNARARFANWSRC